MLPMRALLLAAAFVAAAAAPARADGTVQRAAGCGSKIFVASENGYSVLVASESGVAEDGDKITGDVDRIGFGSFVDVKTGRRFSASIDERGLDKGEITQRIAAACRSQNAGTVTSGQVERADGCRGKIFVNTAQGYAILELLAGGIVAVGDTLNGDFNKPGRATVTNPQTGAELVVFVDDFQLPKSAEVRKVAEFCR
jgi:hypothetical protein